MNRILTLSLAVALAAGLSLTAGHAQKAAESSPAALAAAKEIMAIKKSELIYKGITITILTRAKDTLLQSNVTLGKDLNEVIGTLAPKFAPREKEVADQFVKDYASAFTDQELKEILAFYSSPAGRKLVDQEPKIIDAAMGFLGQWAERMSLEMIDAIRTEMKKRGKEI
jgi:hypothetical protein